MPRNVCNSVQNVPNSCVVALFIDSALQFPPILESTDCSVLPFISPFPFGRQVKAAGGTLRKVCLRQHVLTLRCPSGSFSLRQKRKGYLFFNLAASRLSRSASWDFSRACSSRAALLRTSRSYFSTSIRIESIRR